MLSSHNQLGKKYYVNRNHICNNGNYVNDKHSRHVLLHIGKFQPSKKIKTIENIHNIHCKIFSPEEVLNEENP